MPRFALPARLLVMTTTPEPNVPPDSEPAPAAPAFSPSPAFTPPAQGVAPPETGFTPPAQGFRRPETGFTPPAQGFAPPGAAPTPPAAPYRKIRRSSDDRVIAGVSGGLGRYVNIDPVLFRILFVALTLFGGSGILLYLFAWVAVPEDGRDDSPLSRLLGRTRRRRR
jgi:phage shock protein PspC (stress-responsive transcriptional regulator)